ncbi:hypothetical protein A1Q1_05207 [Trichosporon asahii var. asahii CBS 2479]|uniref:Uncharacterized protein n=1 Tax=Trichosporon asahii var. asahii (strain ATCC 90039 / CBS 2479 / JCM 2466 / KCTC 7840 / NBRC 103889/ NCYC 2677 / UAMH 7654) TaxID=1186058 RepID=J8TSP1_TRIAS|nr:hypothetical protein A1Q1_05207 [Trichosporon asahii var. asahii CBS 2479]EJT53244.1 hypothetical protein A1Q1_05207 [Trichosporon asahii var. asahii CBS 2479]
MASNTSKPVPQVLSVSEQGSPVAVGDSNIDTSPLAPLPSEAFVFPRAHAEEQVPTFPPRCVAAYAAEWAARLATEAWAAAQQVGRLAEISDTIRLWAVVDSVLDRVDTHRARMVADRYSRDAQTPLRRLRSWDSWIYITDDMIIDAFEAAAAAQGLDSDTEEALADLKRVGRVARVVVDLTWEASDSRFPPREYELERNIDPALYGECDPFAVRNAGRILTLAEDQLHPDGLVRARGAADAGDEAWARFCRYPFADVLGAGPPDTPPEGSDYDTASEDDTSSSASASASGRGPKLITVMQFRAMIDRGDDVRGEREPDGSYAYVGTGGGMRVEVGVEDEIENDIDIALENETEDEIGNDIEAELLVNDGTGRLVKDITACRGESGEPDSGFGGGGSLGGEAGSKFSEKQEADCSWHRHSTANSERSMVDVYTCTIRCSSYVHTLMYHPQPPRTPAPQDPSHTGLILNLALTYTYSLRTSLCCHPHLISTSSSAIHHNLQFSGWSSENESFGIRLSA